MEGWQYQEDEMLANPPEGRTSKCLCVACKEPLNEGEEYYELEGDIYCEICAEHWLENQKNYVSGWLAYGE